MQVALRDGHDFATVASGAWELNESNTLLVLLYGDNGSSAYGPRSGFSNWMEMIEGVVNPSPERMLEYLNEWGVR